MSGRPEIDFGWKLSDDKELLYIKWFEGEQVPSAIEAIEECAAIVGVDRRWKLRGRKRPVLSLVARRGWKSARSV